jgi:hypothetical protein
VFLDFCGHAAALHHSTDQHRMLHAGCRTLDDARKKGDLTETQRLGLQFFDDFLQRIPRREVEEFMGIVRGLALTALRELTSLPEEELQHKVQGSWRRSLHTHVHYVAASSAEILRACWSCLAL